LLYESLMKPKQVQKPSILLVDSDREFCRSMALFLREHFSVFVAYSVTDVFYTVYLNNIKILLVNVDALSVRDIEELLHLRRQFPCVKIVALYTYLPQEYEKTRMIREMAEVLLPKPIDAERLLVKIEALLHPRLPFKAGHANRSTPFFTL